MIDPIKSSLALITAGTGGGIVAVNRALMQDIELGLRIILLVASIISVVVGIVIALRRRATPPRD